MRKSLRRYCKRLPFIRKRFSERIWRFKSFDKSKIYCFNLRKWLKIYAKLFHSREKFNLLKLFSMALILSQALKFYSKLSLTLSNFFCMMITLREKENLNYFQIKLNSLTRAQRTFNAAIISLYREASLNRAPSIISTNLAISLLWINSFPFQWAPTQWLETSNE